MPRSCNRIEIFTLITLYWLAYILKPLDESDLFPWPPKKGIKCRAFRDKTTSLSFSLSSLLAIIPITACFRRRYYFRRDPVTYTSTDYWSPNHAIRVSRNRLKTSQPSQVSLPFIQHSNYEREEIGEISVDCFFWALQLWTPTCCGVIVWLFSVTFIYSYYTIFIILCMWQLYRYTDCTRGP